MYKNQYIQSHQVDHKPLNEINVTPFVDVMLVLLVVFMISAPLMTGGVNVNLPANNSASNISNLKPFAITVTKDKKIFYQETAIEFSRIQSFIKNNVLSTNTIIYLRGDKDINYGYIMSVITQINQAGYKKVFLVADSTPR